MSEGAQYEERVPVQCTETLAIGVPAGVIAVVCALVFDPCLCPGDDIVTMVTSLAEPRIS